MLYSYQKATPDHPSPGKIIPRHLKMMPIIISSIGLGLVASVAWPMASYNINAYLDSKNQDFGLLSPIIYESFASEASEIESPTILSEVDYTKASNWFSFSQEEAAGNGGQSVSDFINLDFGQGHQERTRNKVALARPDTTAIAIGVRISAPSPRPMAIGSSPRIVVRLVIRIGRSRTEPAWIIASILGIPCLRRKFI